MAARGDFKITIKSMANKANLVLDVAKRLKESVSEAEVLFSVPAAKSKKDIL